MGVFFLNYAVSLYGNELSGEQQRLEIIFDYTKIVGLSALYPKAPIRGQGQTGRPDAWSISPPEVC
jgi:hypothetical protein